MEIISLGNCMRRLKGFRVFSKKESRKIMRYTIYGTYIKKKKRAKCVGFFIFYFCKIQTLVYLQRQKLYAKYQKHLESRNHFLIQNQNVQKPFARYQGLDYHSAMGSMLLDRRDSSSDPVICQLPNRPRQQVERDSIIAEYDVYLEYMHLSTSRIRALQFHKYMIYVVISQDALGGSACILLSPKST